jgi:hypothetical protein
MTAGPSNAAITTRPTPAGRTRPSGASGPGAARRCRPAGIAHDVTRSHGRSGDKFEQLGGSLDRGSRQRTDDGLGVIECQHNRDAIRIDCTECRFSRLITAKENGLPGAVVAEHGREAGHTLDISPVA